MRRFQIELPAGARALLESGAGETIKPGDERLARVSTQLIATPQMALEAAAKVAALAGYTPLLLGDSIEGEASEVGKVMAGIARQVGRHRQPVAPPCVLLSVARPPSPSRATAAADATSSSCSRWRSPRGHARCNAVAGDTDGVDGQEEIAGAFVAPDTLSRAPGHRGIRPRDSLDNNDGHGFF